MRTLRRLKFFKGLTGRLLTVWWKDYSSTWRQNRTNHTKSDIIQHEEHDDDDDDDNNSASYNDMFVHVMTLCTLYKCKRSFHGIHAATTVSTFIMEPLCKIQRLKLSFHLLLSLNKDLPPVSVQIHYSIIKP